MPTYTKGNPVTSMIAQPFTMPAVSLVVTDASGARTVTFAARVCRMFLANVHGATPGRNAGTADDPDEWLLGHLKYGLNNNGLLSNWDVSMTAAGHAQITYIAGAGTGQIQWDGTGGTSLIPRHLAGFTANVALAPGASVVGDEQVTHAVFSFNGGKDTNGWVPLPKRAALAETDDGRQYGYTASRTRLVWRGQWGWHPRNATQRDQLETNATVYLPTVTSRWTQQSATPSTTNSPPWSILDTWGSVHGSIVGFTQGNLRELVAGTDTKFYNATVRAESLTADAPVEDVVAGWEAWVHWSGFGFNYVGHASR